MVFNIRPFAEEFLNTMAKDFEITVFTAGEQDVSQIYLLTTKFIILSLKERVFFITILLLLFENFFFSN